MKEIFWAALCLIAYAYVGYAALLRALAALRSRPVRKAAVLPSLSVIMAAHNEAANLPAKLRTLQSLDYPRELLEIIIASDGSTDSTPKILMDAASIVTPVILQEPRGKAAALNAAIRKASNEILVFFDTRQRVDLGALRELSACFADPEIGAVSGELILEDSAGTAAEDALGLYWRIEKIVRRLESGTGSVVGVTGAIFAMRRDLFVELPEGTILDDVLTPMNVARAGKRIIFEPRAIARDEIFQKSGKEFRRKVRTLTGNYQLLRLAPWLLSTGNPLLFRFISHKLLRLAVPFLLALLIVSSALIPGTFYRVFFIAQLVFYGLAATGWIAPSARRLRVVAVAETFTSLNAAAAVAFFNFVTGREKVWI